MPLLLVASSTACDVGSPANDADSRGFDRPPLQVGAVTATTAYLNTGPQRTLLSEDAITDDVEISASFELHFDRFLLPRKVIRQALCIHPTSESIASIADCREPFQAFTTPEYNPVRRTAIYRLAKGGRLLADTQYRLTIFRQEDPNASGFFAFDNAPLLRSYSFDFRTKADGATAQDESAPSTEAYCAAQSCFKGCNEDPVCEKACEPLCLNGNCLQSKGDLLGEGALFGSCVFSNCHLGTDSLGAAMGLNLNSSATTSQTAIGMTAHQTQTGEAAHLPDTSGAHFGRAMPLIDPFNPGNSYLLYKLLANPYNHKPDGLLDPQLEAEIGRLRNSVVVGLPMPAEYGDNGQGGVSKAIEPQVLAAIGAWIAHGAAVSCE